MKIKCALHVIAIFSSFQLLSVHHSLKNKRTIRDSASSIVQMFSSAAIKTACYVVPFMLPCAEAKEAEAQWVPFHPYIPTSGRSPTPHSPDETNGLIMGFTIPIGVVVLGGVGALLWIGLKDAHCNRDCCTIKMPHCCKPSVENEVELEPTNSTPSTQNV